MYLAPVALAAAVVLALYVPFFPRFLSAAATAGALTFAIKWFGVWRRASLGFIGTLLSIAAFSLSRRLLLPKGMSGAQEALVNAQFFAVWTLTLAALHVVFRARLKTPESQVDVPP